MFYVWEILLLIFFGRIENLGMHSLFVRSFIPCVAVYTPACFVAHSHPKTLAFYNNCRGVGSNNTNTIPFA